MAVEQHKVLVPPHYSRYVAWGFADHSIRIGPYEMERALFVWEDTPAGEILCCAAPNDKIIITAGTNSVNRYCVFLVSVAIFNLLSQFSFVYF